MSKEFHASFEDRLKHKLDSFYLALFVPFAALL